MTFVEVQCATCGNKFLKELRRINEAKKYHWKIYCSLQCQTLAKNKQRAFRCGNQKCARVFRRSPHTISKSGACFCSRSCAAIVNNLKSLKRRQKIKFCPICEKEFFGSRKYCSPSCQPKRKKVAKKQIINEIKKFYNINGRIPLKREYHHYNAARLRFGTWNEAVKAAGFESNQVIFSKKYFANDGHLCDSLTEKIIDDWLTARKIAHRRNVSYPDSKYTADFLVGNVFIEFFGLIGELKSYDRNIEKKTRLAKENDLKLLCLYPKDLFPKSHLDYLLKSLTETT